MSSNDKQFKTIHSRLKQYFKNSAKNNTRESCEYKLSEEKERELSNASPLSTRCKAMRDLHEPVTNCKFDDISIAKVWGHIEDLLGPTQSQEIRHTTFFFLQSFFKGQYERLGILRAKFFHFIRFHNHSEDILQRFELLKALTDNGRDILHFEGDVGAFLLSWFPDITKAGPAQEFMQFLENVIKFNAVFMYEHVTTGFVQCICDYISICSPTEPAEVLSCLSILDTIVAYSNMPPDSLPQFIGSLCRAVNWEQYSHTSWRIMRNLLGTHMGHSTLFTLCRILQEPELREDTPLLRGAIFYIKMGLWGSPGQVVPSLRIPPSAVLPSILHVVKPAIHSIATASTSSSGGGVVVAVGGDNGGKGGTMIVIAFEVILCVQSLVDTMGRELIESNWEVILIVLDHIIDDLEVVRPYLSAMPPTHALPDVPCPPMSANILQVSNHLHETLDTIEGLIELRQFNGDYGQFYKLLEKCANYRSEKSVKQLVAYLAQDLTPAKTIWLTNLYELLNRYFRVEKRTMIRLQVLEMLEKVVMYNKMRFEDELIDKIVIPYLNSIDLDRDTRIRSACGQFLIDLCSECETKACIQMLEILERLLNRPFDLCEQYNVSASEAETTDTLVVAKGLIRLFQLKIMKLPSSHAIRIYDMLVGHLERHYRNQVVFEKNNKIRLAIFECFLNMRADNLYHLGYLTTLNTIQFSLYICVTYRPSSTPSTSTSTSNSTSISSMAIMQQQPQIQSLQHTTTSLANLSIMMSGNTLSSSSGAMGCSPPPASPSGMAVAACAVTHVCIKAGFKTVVTCLRMERDPEVLGTVADRLPKVLENKAFILSKQGNNDIHLLVEVLHSMFTDKSNLTDLNLKSKMLTILASLASYHAYIETEQQRKMIYCLYKYGLVREWSRQCIITLTTCTLEMQEVMVKMLPDLLLTLSKISAVIHVAIPILEFLSTVTILPTVFASFAAEQYMAVFAISLPYTNPFKFNHYTVSLAHHVIAVWFLKCRLQFRKDFVRFITKGLQTNVRGSAPFFDDSSKIDLSKLNQDSSDRKRSSSLTEPSARRRERASTVSSRMDSANGAGSSKPSIDFNRPSITEDKKLIMFYEELTETCIDLMARYTFSPCSALPRRLPTAEFLLHGGQTMSWLMGNRVITVTTSGCAQKTLRQGLCEKCWSSCDLDQCITTGIRSPENFTRPVSLHTTRSSSHEKDDSHSNTITRQNSNSNSNTSVSSPTEETKKLIDKLEQQLPPSLQMFLDGPDRGEKCACWCRGWAEIHVRRPTGDMSWVMRIQNQISFQHSVYDFPLNELSTLYMPSLHQAGLQVAAAAAAAAAASAAVVSIECSDTSTAAGTSGGDKIMTLQHAAGGGSISAPISIPMSPKHSPSRQTSRDSLDLDELAYEDPNDDPTDDVKSRNPVRRSNSSPEMTNWKNPLMRAAGEMASATSVVVCSSSGPQKGVEQKRERSIEVDLAMSGMHEAKCLIEEEKRAGSRGKLGYAKDMRVSCEAIPEEIAGTTPPTTIDNQQQASTHPTLLSSLSCPSPPIMSSINDPPTQHTVRSIHTVPVSPLVLSNPNQPPIFPTAEGGIGGGNVLFRSSKGSQDSTENTSCSDVLSGGGMVLITGKPPQSPTQTSPRLVRHLQVGGGDSMIYEVQKSSSLVLGKSYSAGSTTSMNNDTEKKRYQMRQPYSSQTSTTSTTSTHSASSASHQHRDRGYTVSVMNTSNSNRKQPVITHHNHQAQTPRKEQPRSGTSPSFVFLQLYHAAQFGPTNGEKPLPVDAAHLVQIQRALKVLDSIPPYETHKIGVIYVGKEQSGNEVEILRNSYGSVRYNEFLRKIGTVIKLQDVDPQVFFLGGLEQNGADGTFAYIWQDDVIRVMFHVATLMPNKDSDPHCTNKKSHIGNNNITIVYNESGEEYNLNTLKGQFNFAAIVVRPLDHNTNKVTVTAKEELIKLIGVHEPKLVSDQNAAIMARQLALHTNLASMVSRSISLKEDDPYASNWLERLRKIKNLRSKVEQAVSDTSTNQPEDRSLRLGQMEDFTEYT